jgi:hypothetical protein
MSVVVVSVAPGVGAEQDAAMVAGLDVEGNPPAGGRLRIAGPTDAGWRIISVWDSQEDWDTFLRDRLGPMFEQAGRPVPEFQISPVESMITL